MRNRRNHNNHELTHIKIGFSNLILVQFKFKLESFRFARVNLEILMSKLKKKTPSKVGNAQNPNTFSPLWHPLRYTSQKKIRHSKKSGKFTNNWQRAAIEMTWKRKFVLLECDSFTCVAFIWSAWCMCDTCISSLVQ